MYFWGLTEQGKAIPPFWAEWLEWVCPVRLALKSTSMQDFNYFPLVMYYIISTTYQKIGDLFWSVHISGLHMTKTICRNTVPNGIIHCGSQCTPFQHSAGHISLHHPPAKLPCSYHYHLGNKWFLRPSLRSNLDFPPGGRYYCHPLWIPFRIVYVS